jgi:hypothetical protein
LLFLSIRKTTGSRGDPANGRTDFARSPIKFKLVWQCMNARCAEYKWTNEVRKTKVRGKRWRARIFRAPSRRQGRGHASENLPESGKFALFRLSNRANVLGRGRKWYRAAALHRAGFQLRHFSSVMLLAALVAPALVRAQLMLPGALQASPSAANKISPNPAGATPGQPRPAGLKPPSEETIFGQELARDGFAGIIAFQRGSDKGLEITRLSIAGVDISHPGEQCQVEVVTGTPIQTRFAGRRNGVSRYEVEIETCPFSLDVLEGAVLVTRTPRTCDFRAADCRVDPAGLWGPPGNAIGPDQRKQLERERGRVDSAMLGKFHALLSSAGKDTEAIKQIASEQAGFSSEREVICRKYLGEDIHGFCALRITEARAIALQAAFEDRMKAKEKAKPAMAKKKSASNFKLNSNANPRPEPGSAPQSKAKSE